MEYSIVQSLIAYYESFSEEGSTVMHFFYGDKNLLRVLDEADFWKQQETEHTVVIREITPGLEKEYVEQLQQWQLAFTQTRGLVIRYIETVIRAGGVVTPEMEQQILKLINYCLEQSQQFIKLLDTLLADSNAVKKNPVAQTVIKHIRRESEYFIGIAQTILYFKKNRDESDTATQELETELEPASIDNE